MFPAAEVVALPVADGGEGSAAAFLTALGGQRVEVAVTGPEGTELESFYALLPDGTAVIEMAAAAGLPQVRERRTRSGPPLSAWASCCAMQLAAVRSGR